MYLSMTPEQQTVYDETGMLPEIVVTPYNAGQNAVVTQWNGSSGTPKWVYYSLIGIGLLILVVKK